MYIKAQQSSSLVGAKEGCTVSQDGPQTLTDCAHCIIWNKSGYHNLPLCVRGVCELLAVSEIPADAVTVEKGVAFITLS